MAKKLIWKDNTEPPKDRIWIKLDNTGNVTGIYEFNGNNWIKIATGTAENMTIVSLDGSVITVLGDQTVTPNTIAVRTETGQLRAADPIVEEDLVTLKMMMWNNA